MNETFLNPDDTPERQNEKLIKITRALMQRVEQDVQHSDAAYAQFERAALLENQVRKRTQDLEYTLDLLNASNAALAEAQVETERAHDNMASAIEAIQDGFALFDARDHLVMQNSRFGQHMPDVLQSIKPGMLFSEYVSCVSQSRFMDFSEGETPDVWAAHRMAMHKEPHVNFNVRLKSDIWLQVSEHRSSNGGTAILQTDVTDIVRLERVERSKLLDDQARFVRATLDHLNQGVSIFDREMRLLGWNNRLSRLLMLPATRFKLGTGFHRLAEHLRAFFEDANEELTRLQDWASEKNERAPLRLELFRQPNLTLDVYAQNMPDGGFVISFTDVSTERSAARVLETANETLERRVHERTFELEDALSLAESANASKSRFVAAASHDLLQPLSAAKLYVSSIDTRDAGVVSKALNALRSAEEIIEALLNISKLDSGAVNLDVTAVPLGKALENLRDQFLPAAELKGIDLRIVPTSVRVVSDPGYLRQILQNLIGNAVKYTDQGRVLVGVRRNGKSARLEVWDTGPGIAEADQDRIFNEFERLGRLDASGAGLGLGLAIVDRACGQLGHPLELQSRLGEGTRFVVSFEVADAERT